MFQFQSFGRWANSSAVSNSVASHPTLRDAILANILINTLNQACDLQVQYCDGLSFWFFLMSWNQFTGKNISNRASMMKVKRHKKPAWRLKIEGKVGKDGPPFSVWSSQWGRVCVCGWGHTGPGHPSNWAARRRRGRREAWVGKQRQAKRREEKRRRVDDQRVTWREENIKRKRNQHQTEV